MKQNTRLVSLDFFRGLTMLLLISGGALQYFAHSDFNGTIAHKIFIQFTHPHYVGLHFWDMIQPFFMFIVGVAVPFSVSKRLSQGYSSSRLTWHAGQRSIILILLGVTLGTTGKEFTLTFQNVLAQIGFTYFITFLLLQTKPSVQLVVSLGLILLTEALYRLFPINIDQPFAMGKTFGDTVNSVIAPGSTNNWASFNAIPTAAHTIWGALVGQLLQSKIPVSRKLKYLIIGSIAALIIGYSITPITPFIKKISTSSFVFASGGWTLLAFTLCYWIIDIKNYQNWAFFGIVVGMNPIFIYLLAGTIKGFIIRMLEPWLYLVFDAWTPEHFIRILLLTAAWFANWYVCYYLYKKRMFFRI